MDGLITNIPGVPLFAFYADCTPIYLVDERKEAIALLHAGWK
ncbi:laccase domain-containing protein [endosymbiont 'TC1' of Trimyema compressum]